MVRVKSVSIDGENIYVFNSTIYLFESSSGLTLELDMIVSEVALKKSKDRESLICEIELEDGRIYSSFMFAKSFPGKLPQLNLFCNVDESEDYEGFPIVSENDQEFPTIEESITLEDIRKVEMPNEKITLKLTLPIDQVEWLKSKKPKELNAVLKELLYGSMEK